MLKKNLMPLKKFNIHTNSTKVVAPLCSYLEFYQKRQRVFVYAYSFFKNILLLLLLFFGCMGLCCSLCAGFSLVEACRWANLLHGIWDLSSLTMVQTHVYHLTRQILNLWTTREVPRELFIRGKKLEWWEEGERNKRQDGLGFEWLVGAFWERNLEIWAAALIWEKHGGAFQAFCRVYWVEFSLVSCWEISLKRWSCYLLINDLLGAKMSPEEAKWHTYLLLSWLIAVSIWIPCSSPVIVISNFPDYTCIML